MGVEPVGFQCRAPVGVGASTCPQSYICNFDVVPRWAWGRRPFAEICEKFTGRSPAGVGGRYQKFRIGTNGTGRAPAGVGSG